MRGVLFAESPHELRFDYEQEDMLVVLAGQLGAAIDQLQDSGANPDQEPAGDGVSADAGDTASGRPRGASLRVRHYQLNNSIFLDDSYLIKGVAGAIFWKLVNDYTRHGRSEFSNRELRLDPAIGLPELTDNLEARLLLLQRRLAEHKAPIQIEKTGRGRFRLAVIRPLALVDNSS